MTVITLDAIESVKELKSVGFTEDQAEVQVKLLLDAINKSEMARLEKFATKHDLKELELRITRVKSDVRRDVTDVWCKIADIKTKIIKRVTELLVVGILIGGFWAVVKLLLA